MNTSKLDRMIRNYQIAGMSRQEAEAAAHNTMARDAQTAQRNHRLMTDYLAYSETMKMEVTIPDSK